MYIIRMQMKICKYFPDFVDNQVIPSVPTATTSDYKTVYLRFSFSEGIIVLFIFSKSAHLSMAVFLFFGVCVCVCVCACVCVCVCACVCCCCCF